MNFRRLEQKEMGFQIAPLINLVFLLLVFFVATQAYQAMEREQKIELPGAQASEPPGQRLLGNRPPEIIVNLTQDGRIIVNRAEWQIDKLRAHLKLLARVSGRVAPTVVIRADRRTEHESVVNVLDACVAANLRSVAFVTVETR